MWISEFGIGAGETGAAARAWFGNVTDYFADHDADFAYWPLVGWQGHDDWALLRYDADGTRHGLLDDADWRGTGWQRLMSAASLTGPVARVPAWQMLATDHGDYVESVRVRAIGDWDPGATKAACPDGLRLIGLGHTSGRGLCTDVTAGDLRAADGAQSVVTDERNVPRVATGRRDTPNSSARRASSSSVTATEVCGRRPPSARPPVSHWRARGAPCGSTGPTTVYEAAVTSPVATTKASARTTSTRRASPTPPASAALRAPLPCSAANWPTDTGC